jgi:hypothetical protein
VYPKIYAFTSLDVLVQDVSLSVLKLVYCQRTSLELARCAVLPTDAGGVAAKIESDRGREPHL